MQGFAAASIRNIVLLSHSGTGKTTLSEALLYATKAISRMGKVEDGNTASDHEPEEVKRTSSIQTSLIPVLWKSHKLNFLDTPGYDDFLGEVISALRAADGAILLVAAPTGVEVGTERAWSLCQEWGLPRLILITKMDREHANFQGALESVQQRFGRRCIPIQLPVGAEQQFQGVVDLLNPSAEVPPEVAEQWQAARERLVEAVAETNDELATKYLEGEELTQEELLVGLTRGVLSGQLVPVLVAAATQLVSIEDLLEAAVHLLPSPQQRPPVETTPASGGEGVSLSPDAQGPLVAQVFKTTADPHVGKLSFFRIYSGTFHGNSEVWNATRGQAERIGNLFVLRGKTQEVVPELPAGDIGVVSRLTVTTTGDSLGNRNRPLILEPTQFPTPNYGMAVSPKSKADLDKMSSALSRMLEEDPSLKLVRDQDTSQSVLYGFGDTHLEMTVEKIRRKFGTELLLQTPRVAYKETLSAPAKVEYRYKQQSGGHGHFAHVFLRLEPLPRGSGVEFALEVVGGAVPREFFPAVEKGVRRACTEGALAGYPIVDVKAVLYDGSSHPVDSASMDFDIAGYYGLKKGFLEGSPLLVEPIMRLRVTVAEQYTGDVIGDLNSRRARILGMTPQDGTTTIEAEVPQAEVMRYAIDLRSLTQGRGSYTVELSHYEEVPSQLSQRIIDQAKRAKETAERA